METDMCKHGEVAAVVQLYKAKLLKLIHHTYILSGARKLYKWTVGCIPVQDVKDDHYETYEVW